MKYLANTTFACGSTTYRPGDEVPLNLQNNDERLKRGLICEVKTLVPTETKTIIRTEERTIKDVNRKSESKTKQAK